MTTRTSDVLSSVQVFTMGGKVPGGLPDCLPHGLPNCVPSDLQKQLDRLLLLGAVALMTLVALGLMWGEQGWRGQWPGMGAVMGAVMGAAMGVVALVFVLLRCGLKRQVLNPLKGAWRYWRHAALVDSLTRLPNRRHFEQRVEYCWTHPMATRSPPGQPAMVVVDVDHFKRINDTFGHATGDVVLQEVARRLSQAVRRRRGALLCRWGGEEFAIFLPGTSNEHALAWTHEILASVRGRPMAGVGELTLSAGLARRQRKASWQATLARADRALLEAKRQGRDRVVVG